MDSPLSKKNIYQRATNDYFGIVKAGYNMGFDTDGSLIALGSTGGGATGYTGYTGPTGYTGFTGYTGPAGSGGAGGNAFTWFLT